ncbi:unnamed protein product [Calypogeia fissa]
MMTFVPGKDKGRKFKKPEMLSPKKQKKATSTSLKVTNKRKSSNFGSEISAHPPPSPSDSGGGALGLTFDLGSAKKLKVRQKAMDPMDEEEEDEFVESARNGVVRKCAFGSQSERHHFVKTSVKASMLELAANKQRPAWITKYKVWLKHVLSLKLRRSAPKLEGNIMKGAFADMGFIFLPNSLCAHVHDKEVPKWNLWDDSIPVHFFRFMDKILSDIGFLAVLHNEEFEHTLKVRDAAGSSFKHFCSFQILLPTPMFKEHVDVQVQILSLSIFCREENNSKLPRDSNFVPVFSG